MRKLIAWAFMYSLDGLLADEGTEYWQFCFGLPVDPAETKQKLEIYEGAYAHIMGRTTYEAMAEALPTANHPFTGVLNAARKVVFSRTLRTAEWANTTIAAGDTREEIDKLRQGGDGHIVVWGGVSFWRSLMRLDLIDEFRLDLHPYVAGEGTRLFDDDPKNYRLDLVSSTKFSNGIVGLQYRRLRKTGGREPRGRRVAIMRAPRPLRGVLLELETLPCSETRFGGGTRIPPGWSSPCHARNAGHRVVGCADATCEGCRRIAAPGARLGEDLLWYSAAARTRAVCAAVRSAGRRSVWLSISGVGVRVDDEGRHWVDRATTGGFL